MRPDQQDFQGTAVTVELARKLGVPDMFVIVNKVPPDTDYALLRSQVRGLFHVDVEAILPLSVEMARTASGDIFCNRYPSHPLTMELKRVVERLTGEASH